MRKALDTNDYSNLVMRMVDPSGELSVYVHNELEDPETQLCEQCGRAPGYGEEVPVGLRFWVSEEIAQEHDWPHTNLSYCGECIGEMLVEASEHLWSEGVSVSFHYRPKNVDDLVQNGPIGSYVYRDWENEGDGVYEVVAEKTENWVAGFHSPVMYLRKL